MRVINHVKVINQTTIETTFRLLSFSSYILQVCFYTIFYIQDFLCCIKKYRCKTFYREYNK